VILRDRNVSGDTDDLEERRCFCQNWRADVSAIVTDTGKMVEWVKYSAYGVAFGIPMGDTDGDGDWDATDNTNLSGNIDGSGDVRQDCNLDGAITAADVTHANSITGGYQTLGRGVLSSTGVGNRKGYAGYEYDPALAGSKWHVRYRVFSSELGRWLTSDPAEDDPHNTYSYASHTPVVYVDPLGLAAQQCTQVSSTQAMDWFPTFPLGRCIFMPTHPGLPDPPPPPRCYSCAGGMGEQRDNPGWDCDICCTKACDDEPGLLGATVCCGQTNTGCVCTKNIAADRSRLRYDSCFRKEYAKCIWKHEWLHTLHIDCSSKPRCSYTPRTNVPWIMPCGGEWSEWRAARLELSCIKNIDCTKCPSKSERDSCAESKKRAIMVAEQAVSDWKFRWDWCREHQILE
jgi:RHS repeat-associated protein